MCDPISLGVMAIAGGGKLFEGIASSNAHDRAADFASANAHLLDQQAEIAALGSDTAIARGNFDEVLSRRKVGHVLASETASYASGNVDPTFGSPLVVQGFSAAQGETETQLIRAHKLAESADALTRAAGIQGQAFGQASKAAAESEASDNALISGVLGAATSMLTAGSKWPGLGAGGNAGGAIDIGPASNPFVLNFRPGM